MPKALLIFSIVIFGVIGFSALVQKWKQPPKRGAVQQVLYLEPEEDQPETSSEKYLNELQPIETVITETDSGEKNAYAVEESGYLIPAPDLKAVLPEADRIHELFNKKDPKLPIVETITYKSRVPWLKGRPAWLSDYATHYKTSRHFIARSLNGKPEYFKQDLKEGERFNVFKQDKNIQFHLLIDMSRCKMWFSYIDLDTHQKVLLKTYQVGLGRLDKTKPSGSLTPIGKYLLGDKIAVYKPKVMGHHNGQKVEMVRIFGTRWIPFDKELEEGIVPARGFGIHGTPWVDQNGELAEDISSIGKYESDGCIRLSTADIEELFAIVVTKPTIVELVPTFSQQE